MDDDGVNCPDCGKYFRTKYLLKVHFKQEQKNSILSVCRLCKLTFVLNKNLVIHEQLHHTTKFQNLGQQDCERLDSDDADSNNLLNAIPPQMAPIANSRTKVCKDNTFYSRITGNSPRSKQSPTLVNSESGNYNSTAKNKFPCKYCGQKLARKCHVKRHQIFSCKVLKRSNFSLAQRCKNLGQKPGLRRLSGRNIKKVFNQENTKQEISSYNTRNRWNSSNTKYSVRTNKGNVKTRQRKRETELNTFYENLKPMQQLSSPIASTTDPENQRSRSKLSKQLVLSKRTSLDLSESPLNESKELIANIFNGKGNQKVETIRTRSTQISSEIRGSARTRTFREGSDEEEKLKETENSEASDIFSSASGEKPERYFRNMEDNSQTNKMDWLSQRTSSCNMKSFTTYQPKTSSQTLMSDIDFKPIVCALCNHRFTAKRGLLKHLRNACRYRNIRCIVCEGQFKDANDFKKHIEEFHKKPNVSGNNLVSMMEMVPLDKKPGRFLSTSFSSPSPSTDLSTRTGVTVETRSNITKPGTITSSHVPIPATMPLMDTEAKIANPNLDSLKQLTDLDNTISNNDSEIEEETCILANPHSLITGTTINVVKDNMTMPPSHMRGESMEHKSGQIEISQEPSWIFETLADTMPIKSELENTGTNNVTDNVMYSLDLMNVSCTLPNEESLI